MALMDYYNTGDNGYGQFDGVAWNGQTFTASSTYTLTSIKFLVLRVFTPSDVTVSIRATSGGLPTGEDLCSETFDGNTLTTDSAGEWKEITFSSPIVVTSETVYAIIVRGAEPYLRWRWDDSSPTYTGGSRVGSADSGSTWTAYTGEDYMFEVYGTAVTPSKPTTPSPANTATNITLDQATLSWTAGANTDTFNIYFGESGSEVLVAEDQDVSDEDWAIVSLPLSYNTIYGWRVDAKNTNGTTTGDTWTFTTITFAPPVPTGKNTMQVIKRLVAAADDAFFYEDV